MNNREKKNEYMRKYYLTHKEEYSKRHKKYYNKNKEHWLEYNKNLRKEKRLECLTHYGGNPPKCDCCGEMHIEFLTIDHIEGGGNKHRNRLGLRGSFLYYWLIKNNFPEGYRVLCYNCNCSIGFNEYCPHKREVLIS